MMSDKHHDHEDHHKPTKEHAHHAGDEDGTHMRAEVCNYYLSV